VYTPTVAALLNAGLDSASRHAGWRRIERFGISMRHCYRLWHQLVRAQSHLRTVLMRCCSAPACTQDRPLAQLRMHLQHRCHELDGTLDEFAMFHLHFQQPSLASSAIY
jgi:hypothetical protein